MTQPWMQAAADYVATLEREKAADHKAFYKANGAQRTIDAIKFMQAQISRLQVVQ
jgi:hypothetical protein